MYPFTLANTGISTLIGVGSASILSRAIGKKDQETIDKIMGNLIALNVIFSLIIMAVGMIFTKQILMLSGAKGEILELAIRYLRIIFAGSLFVNFAQSANMIMRGEGLLKRAMVFSAGSAIMNIILGATYRVMSFAFIPLWGLSQGYQPAAGTNYGAKQYDRVKYITKIFSVAATLLALIF